MQPEGEEKLLLARAEDAIRLAERQYCARTLGFLNPRQRLFLERRLTCPPDLTLFFDGGYEEAERTVMVCHPAYGAPEREEYLSVLECTGRDLMGLSHRDYLGSLMGLGIVRENIGDILVTEEKTVLFVKPEIESYILQNLTKVGNRGIRLEKVTTEAVLLPERPTKEIRSTVAGLRLDAVLATAAGIGRGKAAELIRIGQVTINWETVTEVSATVREGDVLSARGYGRMKLTEVGGLTRKGRYGITLVRYI